FQSLWFATGLAALVVSVSVCTANRLGPVWRNVTKPLVRVPDDYFDKNQPIVSLASPDTAALAAALRRKRIKVVALPEAGATYVFADRFPWAQIATFVSHLALILFIAGGLVTVMTAKQYQVLAGEGTSEPIFLTSDRDHMQVYVKEAVGRFDATGF